MKIGIDIRNIGKKRTGDETVFFNLVKNLAEIDKSNEYLLFTDLGENVVAQISQKLGILGKSNFKLVSLKSGNKFIWNLWTLPNYLRKNPVDVYHTQYITPFFVSRKIRIITHIHDVSFNAYPEFIKKSDLFFLKLLIPGSLRRADKIIAVSEFTKQEIIKYYSVDPEKIEVVYNAIGSDFSSDNYSEDELKNVRRGYDLPDKFVLYVGTLQPRKNIPMLIKAFNKIKDKISDVQLVLAGDESAYNFDKKISEEIKNCDLSKRVIFLGYVDRKDLPIVYELASVFVFPSLYEGFGIPILEAMSQNTPVLVSDISVHQEIAEGAVSYFQKDSLDDFSEKLYNSLIDENLRNKLKNLGLQRVNFFSWKKSAEKLVEIYKNLLI